MTKSKFNLTFHGGAQTVTGANFLLEGPAESTEKISILVDCGLEQGSQFCENCNADDFAYDPASVDYLLVTHAHLDHIGRIPKLVKDGFKGTIYSTPGTYEIATVMFEDSADILRREAEREGREPLYGEADVARALSLWKTVTYYTHQKLNEKCSFYMYDAGHILGSAMIEVTYGESTVLFTGDVGNSPAPLLRDTDPITRADYIVMESVYGDRNHEDRDIRRNHLRQVFKDSIDDGGVLMIPAFSIERTQNLLYELNNMVEDGEIPSVPVYVDSPLAIKVTDVYASRTQNFKGSVQEEIKEGDDVFDFPNLHFTMTRDESRAINGRPAPKIIIAGSGMSHGGRIVHHEKRYLSDPKNTILFIGYQAAGSLGRKIQEGNREVLIHDDSVRVRAKIETISGYSAHKDRDRLLEMIEPVAEQVKRVFVAMGEPKSSLFLTQRLRDYLDIDAVAPRRDETFEIEL